MPTERLEIYLLPYVEVRVFTTSIFTKLALARDGFSIKDLLYIISRKSDKQSGYWHQHTDRQTDGRTDDLCIKRVKCTLTQALRLCTGRMNRRGSRGIALLFLDHGSRRGEGSASRPGRSLPPEKTRYPLYRRLGGPQGRSGQARRISSQPGFDPRTVQPVAQSLYRLSYRAHICA